jgi:hypothetical protein
VTGVAEYSFAKSEDLCGDNREHERLTGFVEEASISWFELPLTVPFLGPKLGEMLHQLLVDDTDACALFLPWGWRG